jgi:hypothetical protein
MFVNYMFFTAFGRIYIVLLQQLKVKIELLSITNEGHCNS